MNLNEYKQFVQHRDTMEEEIASLATEYAYLFGTLNNDYQLHYGDVEMTEDLISIRWRWFGSYQSEEHGYINVEPEILFGSKENWKPYIEKCIKEKKDAENKIKKEKEEKNKQEQIAKAREVLNRYQENFLYGD